MRRIAVAVVATVLLLAGASSARAFVASTTPYAGLFNSIGSIHCAAPPYANTYAINVPVMAVGTSQAYGEYFQWARVGFKLERSADGQTWSQYGQQHWDSGWLSTTFQGRPWPRTLNTRPFAFPIGPIGYYRVVAKAEWFVLYQNSWYPVGNAVWKWNVYETFGDVQWADLGANESSYCDYTLGRQPQ